MGLFDSLSRIANEAAARRKSELESAGRQIEHLDLEDACMHYIRRFNSWSLSMKNSMLTVLNKKIVATEDTRELNRAFQTVYEWAQHKHDTIALNLAQRLGKQLYRLNPSLVNTKEVDGKTFYSPANNYYF